MTKLKSSCLACGSPETDELLRPYCSVVCRVVGRFGLGWRTNPYRIVVSSHLHLVIQSGLNFDLRTSVLKGERERVLATERKRRQRAVGRFSNVTPNNQFNTSIGRSFSISAVENLREAERHGN